LIPTASAAREFSTNADAKTSSRPRNGRFPLKFLISADANRKTDKLGLLVAKAINR
jgi:hypothetical protein